MRKALVVGINDYDNISSLNWCENDAMGMSQALERHASGDPNFSTQLLTTNTLYTTNFTEPLSYQGSAFLKLPKFP